jgi:hypothetical protein
MSEQDFSSILIALLVLFVLFVLVALVALVRCLGLGVTTFGEYYQ